MNKRKNWTLVLLLAILIGTLCVYMMLQYIEADTQAPKISVDENLLTVSVLDGDEALLQGIKAVDNADGDVTDLIVVESIYGISDEKCVTVTYAAFDHSGNVSKLERQVMLADYQSPKLTLFGPLVFEDGFNANIMSLVSAEDMRDGNLQHKLKATSMSALGSITEIGIHDIQFRVTNSLGDTQHLMLPLEVCPKDKYNAELTLTDYLVYLPVGGSFNARNYLKQFDVLGDSISLSEVDVQIKHQVDVSKPGVYPVTYTGSYSLNNRSYTAYTKLIVVVEG